MIIQYTENFKRKYNKLPENIQKAFDKQLELFINNMNPPFHPSLRIKMIKGTGFIYEMTITKSGKATRATFEFIADLSDIKGIIFRNIGAHDLTLKNP